MLRITNFSRVGKFEHLMQGCRQQKQTNRQIWGYVAIAFNQVDANRLELVGPDRLCAEWLLKNGGAVRFMELPGLLINDYDILPPESTKLRIKVADATNSSVMKIGLEHFKGCSCIETVIFNNCKHLEEDGLQGLTHLTATLRELCISSCDNLKDHSFDVIGELKNLNIVTLSELRYVKDIDKVAAKIQAKLLDCLIQVVK